MMDDTHREFVELLAQAENAADDALAGHWRTLVEHTDDHFSREDRWMLDTRFSSSNCHTVQHKVVLQVMREGLLMAQAGDFVSLRHMAKELGLWFPQHAQTMDAALALHLRGIGYDPVTGVVSMPQALPKDTIQGCGSLSCSPERPALEPSA